MSYGIKEEYEFKDLAFLVSHKANINHGSVFLNLYENSLKYKNTDFMRQFFTLGLDPNVKIDSKEVLSIPYYDAYDYQPAGMDLTPLICVSFYYKIIDPEIMRLLVDLGADINGHDTKGRTALHWAVLADNEGAVKVLLELGIDRSVQDSYGMTAGSLAELNGLQHIVNLINN